LSSKSCGELKIGVSTLPVLPKDTTDRNRTSPFAFTGNKFEFRMVPSSASIAGPNFVLNTIVAEVLSQIADKLENATDFNSAVQSLLQEIVKNHKRIIFNGNNYTDEWVKEAETRGLPNIRSTVEAIPALIKEKNIAVLSKHGVLSKVELESRYEINLENYIKTINIEALTMLEMAKRQILPASIEFATSLANSINSIKATGLDVDISAQSELLAEVFSVIASFKKNIALLENAVATASDMHGDSYKQASFYKDEVFSKMNILRADGDKLETIVDEKFWPIPTYGDMLFNV
jgi:glutamine synthetase